ncbi:MAG: class II fructose-bisphosphate aldolase, partial [Candidatus Ornithospirochaeta sp.]|nr:class II fructose-bisphosphate aldolase [Candidatus Ornithospirochaeta sp.]
NKGANAVVRKEIAIAIKECLRHEGIQGVLVSHGSSTVPRYIVDEINALGGDIQNAYGIPLSQLKEVSHCGIGKINVDTDIRLAVTRNIREYFVTHPEAKEDDRINGIWNLMENNPKVFDPRAFLTPIMDTVMYGNVPNDAVLEITNLIRRGVMEVVGSLIVEFGEVGKASKVEVRTLDEMAEFYRKEGI